MFHLNHQYMNSRFVDSPQFILFILMFIHCFCFTNITRVCCIESWSMSMNILSHWRWPLCPHSTDPWSLVYTVVWQSWSQWAGPSWLWFCPTASYSTASLWSRASGCALRPVWPHWPPSSWSPITPGRWVDGESSVAWYRMSSGKLKEISVLWSCLKTRRRILKSVL